MNLTWARGNFPVVMAIAFLLCSISCSTSHPTDYTLEQNLRLHQADFDKLVSMLNEDKDILRISDENVFFNEHSKHALPQERLNEYRHFFKKLELEGGVHREGNNTLIFIASNRGLLIPNSGKTYVYTLQPPSPIVDSLDDIIKSKTGDQTPIYKRLYGHWYLAYESW